MYNMIALIRMLRLYVLVTGCMWDWCIGLLGCYRLVSSTQQFVYYNLYYGRITYDDRAAPKVSVGTTNMMFCMLLVLYFAITHSR